MRWVHDAFRRALDDATDQIDAVSSGDQEGAARFCDYLCEALWLLHAHHEAEDELLYPLLVERVPEARTLFSSMDGQHASVSSKIEEVRTAAASFRESGSPADGERLAGACRALRDELADHLTQEEEEVVPIASRKVTPQEWGALPAHAFASYRGSKPWLPLGLATELFPDEIRAQVYGHLPEPMAQMWSTFGAQAFADEMAAIRSASRSGDSAVAPRDQGTDPDARPRGPGTVLR